MLSLAIFFPLLGALLIATLPEDRSDRRGSSPPLRARCAGHRGVHVHRAYDRGDGGYQFVNDVHLGSTPISATST